MGKGSRQDPLAVIISFCPKVSPSNCEITSAATTRYNCVALAVKDDKRWYEPSPGGQYFWPIEKPYEYSLDSYVRMFRALGFFECLDGQLEYEYEKIVLYADAQGDFTHVALQSGVGRWMSKLGDLEDVEHSTPDVLEGPAYGQPCLYMKRRHEGQSRLL